MSKKEEILIANYCFNNFSYSINSRLTCKYEINFFVWANAYKIPFFSPSLGSTKHLVSYNPHKMTADQEKKGDDKISKEERLTQYSNTEFFHIQEQILQHILLFYNFLFSWFQDFAIDYEHLVNCFSFYYSFSSSLSIQFSFWWSQCPTSVSEPILLTQTLNGHCTQKLSMIMKKAVQKPLFLLITKDLTLTKIKAFLRETLNIIQQPQRYKCSF